MTAAVAERAMVEPAHVHIPPRARSLGQQVTAVSASVGRVLDEEQRFAVDVLTSRRADGTPAALEGALVTCRQNMKTFVGEDIVLTYLIEPESDVQLIVWSAHEFATAQETFRHFDDLCAGYPHLSRRVVKVYRGNGEEAIEFAGGRRLLFRARTKAGGRGLTGDVVVLDEGFALQPAHMGALLPTLSTRRRAQVLYLSSAGLATSAVLRGVRDRGRRGGPGAPAYVEWCAPGSLDAPGCRLRDCDHTPGMSGCVLDDEGLWQEANPALGRRITVEFVRQERAAMPPAEFARERLGWWDSPSGEASRPIDSERWSALADRASRRADWSPVAMGIDVARDRSSAAIGWVGRREDGRQHWEVVRHARGIGWVPAAAAELVQKMPLAQVEVKPGVFRPAIAGDALALKPLLPALQEAGVDPVLLGASDIAAACTGMADDVDEDRARHLGQEQLDRAVQALVRRDVGDGGMAFGKKVSGADITPAYAVAAARHVFRQSEVAREVVPMVAYR